jgi:hypothetical protein
VELDYLEEPCCTELTKEEANEICKSWGNFNENE